MPFLSNEEMVLCPSNPSQYVCLVQGGPFEEVKRVQKVTPVSQVIVSRRVSYPFLPHAGGLRVFTAARMLLQRATPPKINKTHLLQRPISPSFHGQIISNLIF